MLRIKNLSCFLVLSIVLLISGCTRSIVVPVDRVVIQIETQVVAVEPPRRPDQIGKADFARFEIITQTNIQDILEAVDNGEKAPLNHVALPYNDYLNMANWMEKIEAYIKQSEKYFDTVDAEYKRINSKKLEKKQ